VFTNKHVVIALIVAPILSVLAWFAVGSLTGEQAAPAEAGRDYPLVAKSSCRWSSGQCELENEDFELTLRYSDAGNLLVHSAFPLEGVVVSVYDPEARGEIPPVALLPVDSAGHDWRHPASDRPVAGERIRLVAAAEGSRYYGEMSTAFAQAAEDALPQPNK
jgi:hypothetical protein